MQEVVELVRELIPAKSVLLDRIERRILEYPCKERMLPLANIPY